MTSTRRLLLVVVVLLLYTANRLHNLSVFPPFLDEVDHIAWASDVYDLHPFTGAKNGKLFGLWWMTLFDLRGDRALWVVRAATVLFSVMNIALLIDLGRRLNSQWAGFLAAILYIASPYAYFYDRMALMDTYVVTWALFVLWFAVRYTNYRRIWDAVACGVALVGVVLAKATGIMLVAVPVIVFVLAKIPLHKRMRGLIISLGTFGALWIPIFLFLRWRGYDYFGTATTVVGTSETGSIFSRLPENIVGILQIDVTYFTLMFVMVGLMLALCSMATDWRRGVMLLGVAVIPLGGLLAFATKLSPRYFHFHVPFVLLMVAVGAVSFARLNRAALYTVLGGTALWIFAFALPFQWQYQRDPANLDIPPLDRLEYIESDAAGFAIADVAAHIEAEQPDFVMGMISNCGALDYAVAIPIECPVLALDGSTMPEIARRLDQLAAEYNSVWLVYESLAFTDLDALPVENPPIATYPRPRNVTELVIYRITRP